MFLYSVKDEEEIEEEDRNFYVNLFVTKAGYLKKITSQSLRLSHEQKLKEKDEICLQEEVLNDVDVLFFTDKGRMYRLNLKEIKENKASAFGEYMPAYFKFEDDEKIIKVLYTDDYDGNLMFFYKNGKVSKVSFLSYKTNRKKLLTAFSKDVELVSLFLEKAESFYMMCSNNEKAIIVSSSLAEVKSKKDSKGVSFLRLNKNCVLKSVRLVEKNELKNLKKFVVEKIPSSGRVVSVQLSLNEN